MIRPSVVPLSTGAICLLAFGGIVLFTATIQQYLPHSEDEVAYLFQAQVFAQNRLTVPTPPLADAFWTPFVVDYEGKRFGKYPPGWPLLLSLGVRLGRPWLVNPVLATVTLALMAYLGHKFYPAERGWLPLLVASLGLTTPGFLFLSSSLLSHSASLFWTVLALLALYLLTSTSRPLHIRLYALLCGGFLGAIFVTRPAAALGIALPIGVFLLILIFRTELRWPVFFCVTVGGLIIALLLPLYWWFVAGDWRFNPYLLVWPYDRMGFGPDVGPHGYTLSNALFINMRLKLATLATGLFGWPGWTNLLFLPLPFVASWFDRAMRPNRWDWLLLGLIGGLMFIHLFYWAFGGTDGGFPRYYFDALPALLLLTIRGVLLTAHWLNRWAITSLSWQTGNTYLRFNWVVAVCIAGLVLYSFFSTLPPLLTAQKAKYGITPDALNLIREANPPTPALILVQNVKSWSDFAPFFVANSPTLDGPLVYAIDWGAGWAQRLQAQFSDRNCWQLTTQQLLPCNKENYAEPR